MSDRHMGERDRDAQSARPQTLIGRIDRFCTRINDGLAVFAAVLAVVVLVTAVIRVPDLLAQGLAVEAEQGATPAGDWAE
jgi:hypothetical protein